MQRSLIGIMMMVRSVRWERLGLTSSLHEGEQVVQELLSLRIIVDFVQLQWRIKRTVFSKLVGFLQ